MSVTVAVCLDDEMGMMFNSRRQSRDRVLIEELLSSSKERIYIHPYSRLLFPDSDRITVTEDPLGECEDGICFIENLPILPYKDKIRKLIIYKWNRLYPADKYFDLSLEGKRRISKTEFKGSSHERITKEIYI